LVVRTGSRALFSLFFSGACGICVVELHEISRIPAWQPCLHQPEAWTAEFFGVSCRTLFENAFPLDSARRCVLCRNGLRGFDTSYCFGSYGGLLRELIHLFKYGKLRTLAGPLGDLLGSALPREEQLDAIVPIPFHWRQQWQRGFNQSELLARVISRRAGISAIKAPKRVQLTQARAGLRSTGRRKNASGAFLCRRAHTVAGKQVLLIDDVLMTGFTAASYAVALKQAGPHRVVLLTLARVDRRMEGWRAAPAYAAAGGVA
jgi:ComF family protein